MYSTTCCERTGLLLVTAGITECCGKYLMEQRRPDQTMPERWDFPGGKMKPRDKGSLEACLIREWKEEVGVRIVVGEPVIEPYYHQNPGTKPIKLHAYYCDIVEGKVGEIGLEGNRLGWFSLDEMRALDIVPADLSVIAVLREKVPVE